ncbi:nucleoside deaminase, partial [Patescibacteria group bacterium]
MNQEEKYIKLAIKTANESGSAMGAVLVKDYKVVAVGNPQVKQIKDPTAHGECVCMRKACQKLDTVNLTGCTLYTTLEPCSMCLACASWSKVSKIVFGAYQEDIPPNPYEITDYHAEEHAKKLNPPIEIVGGVLRKECA